MATTPTVLGNGPLEYTDPKTGQQVSIPLSALKFDGKSFLIDSNLWPPAGQPNFPAFVTSLLADLAHKQLIVPAPVPSPKPALVVSASAPGTAGNQFTVAIAITHADPDPTKQIFSFTITEVETFTKLDPTSSAPNSPATIKKALASSRLVTVDKDVVKTLFPTDVMNPISLSGNPARIDVLDKSKKPTDVVFGLAANKIGDDGKRTSIVIKGDGTTTPPTFALTVTWQKQLLGLSLGSLPAGVTGCDVQASLPPSGIFSVPAAGTVQLTGGTDTIAASAVIFATQ